MATPAVDRTQRKPLQQSRTHLESTPDIDMDSSAEISSEDTSFESAIDESLEGTVSPLSIRPRLSEITDPFVAGSPLRNQIMSDDSSDEDDGEGDSETASEAELSSIVDDVSSKPQGELTNSPISQIFPTATSASMLSRQKLKGPPIHQWMCRTLLL